MEAEIPIRSAYVAEGAERDDRLRDILKRAATRGTALLEVTRSELDRLTGGALHQGIALQLPAFDYAHPDDLLSTALASDQPPLIVALDSITDPRNLGAIVRSAAAFGAHGVLIPQRRTAGMTAAAWKTSAGAAAHIPIARATNLNRSLRAAADASNLIGLDGEADMSIRRTRGLWAAGAGRQQRGRLSRLVHEACDFSHRSRSARAWNPSTRA
jgi:23S rRNA (guanosine2251-2'-O)-methyltransferase